MTRALRGGLSSYSQLTKVKITQIGAGNPGVRRPCSLPSCHSRPVSARMYDWYCSIDRQARSAGWVMYSDVTAGGENLRQHYINITMATTASAEGGGAEAAAAGPARPARPRVAAGGLYGIRGTDVPHSPPPPASSHPFSIPASFCSFPSSSLSLPPPLPYIHSPPNDPFPPPQCHTQFSFNSPPSSSRFPLPPFFFSTSHL